MPGPAYVNSPCVFAFKLLALGGLAVSATGCGTLSYLLQAGRGQLAIINRARPIDEVLKDETIPTRIKTLLREVPAIKQYGESQGLRPTPNYRDYVQLDRSAASYVVAACRPLKFEAKSWSFPIVGSFPYLGWFDLDAAKAYAKELRHEDWDVELRGARAFSTLGWFRDPILSSMIPDTDETLGDLVNVILHESVHATYYVSGQSYFNESLADFVAGQLTPTYLAQAHGVDSEPLRAYTKSEVEGQAREKDFRTSYAELERLYASSAPDVEKLERKAKMLGDLKTRLGFKRDINNATLVQFKTYGSGKQEFQTLLRACGGEWARFWRAINRIDGSALGTPQQQNLGPALLRQAQGGC